MIFIVAALLFYQSHTEGFANWNPSQQPIAGRRYNPNVRQNPYNNVPTDLINAPRAYVAGSIPLSQQRPDKTPGTGTTTAPREAMAQLKDLYDLDNRIILWLDAAGQKEREQPGSLTSSQLEKRVVLQGRLAEVRDQLGTGMITDTWKKVSDEARMLRVENAGWQARSPSLESVYEFGKGKDPEEFMGHEDYIIFYGLFNAAMNELQGRSQPDPLQKVRLQQLQVMRRDLMETAAKVQTPPIRFKAAQLYLRQMLKPDQPLPTLFAMEPQAPKMSLGNNPIDVLSYLRDLQVELTVRYDPASQELKRAAAAMMNRVKTGEISAHDARSNLAKFNAQRGPVAFGSPAVAPRAEVAGPSIPRAEVAGPCIPRTEVAGPCIPRTEVAGPCIPRTEVAGPRQRAEKTNNPASNKPNPSSLIKRATVLCKQIGEAFPEDTTALGCGPVHDEYEAETVINTVCDRLRWSVPSVTPEQFNCPPRKM
jgi:hypothetical protein